MIQEIHYVKADPSGNTTILVLDEIPPSEHAAIAERLLQPDCVGAEQVAFLSPSNQGAQIRLDMMGGEVCGNASRSAAAYLLSQSGAEAGEYMISCSGCSAPLQARVQRGEEDQVYDASIDMPLPKKMDTVSLDVGSTAFRFYRVALPGIVHFVHFTTALKNLDRDQIWKAVYNFASTFHYEAFGLDLVDRKTLTMIPAVYVTATKTLYWEQSCGSGSAATAAALSQLCGHEIACEIRQPGGMITIEAAVSDGEIKKIHIGGPVRLEKEQCVQL